MIKEFRKLYLPNEETIARVQDAIKATFDSFLNDVLLNKIELDATITTSDTVIFHGLKKLPKGFIVFDKTANADIWRVAWTTTTITLRASATVDAKIFLF